MNSHRTAQEIPGKFLVKGDGGGGGGSFLTPATSSLIFLLRRPDLGVGRSVLSFAGGYGKWRVVRTLRSVRFPEESSLLSPSTSRLKVYGVGPAIVFS